MRITMNQSTKPVMQNFQGKLIKPEGIKLPESWERNLPGAIKILNGEVEMPGVSKKIDYLSLIEEDVHLQGVEKTLLPGNKDQDVVVISEKCIPGTMRFEMPTQVKSPVDIAEGIILSIIGFKENICSKCPVGILKALTGL